MTKEDVIDTDIYEFQDPEDLKDIDVHNIVVYSRDWTIDTISSQINQGNIDLNPKFQRRNAWNDKKRSKLIESIILGYPVPEIVLAENKERRRSFIVIDGKQRLLTIAGFIYPNLYNYWDSSKPKLTGLDKNKKLNGLSYEDFKKSPDILRDFENSALCCTVISNYKEDDVLYDIFYRLNAGSTPLATQELRQTLIIGGFSDYLLDETNERCSIHTIMGIDGPDKRLRDVEVILRLMSFLRYSHDYKGNLKTFLDAKMVEFNELWKENDQSVRKIYERVNDSLCKLEKVFGCLTKVGHKYIEGQFEKKFNRVLLEVEVIAFDKIDSSLLTEENNNIFMSKFKELCDEAAFRTSVETSVTTQHPHSNIRRSENDAESCHVEITPFLSN